MSVKKRLPTESSHMIKEEDVKTNSHISEFSEVIKCIETKKNFLYFNFIINIGKHFLQSQDEAGKDKAATDVPGQQNESNMLSSNAIDFL